MCFSFSLNTRIRELSDGDLKWRKKCYQTCIIVCKIQNNVSLTFFSNLRIYGILNHQNGGVQRSAFVAAFGSPFFSSVLMTFPIIAYCRIKNFVINSPKHLWICIYFHQRMIIKGLKFTLQENHIHHRTVLILTGHVLQVIKQVDKVQVRVIGR